MFNLFKSKADKNIYAPVSGLCLDITNCKDQTFSNKLLGDGFMIIPDNDLICSPCDGMLTMVFPTKHAFGIKMDNGQEIMVHIGTDTVNLNGQGFQLLTKVNKRIKAGTPIVKCDFPFIQSQNLDTSVIVILLETEKTNKMHLNETVQVKEVIVQTYENNQEHKQ